jgi:antitoxin CcdA
MKINLSATLERALQEKLAEASSEVWAEKNRTAIRAYNEFVEEHGCFGEEYRKF